MSTTERIDRMMVSCYKVAESLPEGSKKWLIEFAGELLEASRCPHDEKTPEELLKKCLKEFVGSQEPPEDVESITEAVVRVEKFWTQIEENKSVQNAKKISSS